ncbi:MAG: NAD(P)/FAD-dependent oxidoreductase [Syntrophales bacterium]|jgi:NADH dehydrogenase
MDTPIRIGILGGGFGGLYSVFHIQKHLGSQADITLIDRNNYFLYTPMLHEMSTGTVNPRHAVVPIRKIVNPKQVHIRCEEVVLVDLAKKSIQTTSNRFEFDFLIIAHGSTSNFYNLPGVEENGLTFKRIGDATNIRNWIIEVLEKGALENNLDERKKILTINVAGGGCTGIELVSEIAQFIHEILGKDYPEIDRHDVTINLIEATGKILSSFPDYLAEVAHRRLMDMGIRIHLDSPIQWVNEKAIGIRDGRKLPRGLMIWAGGIMANHLDMEPNVKRDWCNRIIVDESLQVPSFPGIYVIGDASHTHEDKRPLPATASVAVQQARYAALHIHSSIQKSNMEPFRFNYRGDMASLGFMFGVCEIYGWQFKGFIAWMIWKLFKLAMMPRYKNRFQILADWVLTFIFKRDTSRLS